MSDLATKRATLRRPRLSDFESMRKLESDADIMKFTPSRVPQTPEQTEKRLQSQIAKESEYSPLGVWIAETKTDQKFVGWFMLLSTDLELTELGFMVERKFWNQGYATEISKALIEHGAKNLNLSGFSARTSLDNEASIRVLENCGFQFLKIINVKERNFDGYVDLKLFQLIL